MELEPRGLMTEAAITAPSWHPILPPRLAERARSAVRDILGDLHRLTADGEFTDDPTLTTGSAGLALLAAYSDDFDAGSAGRLEIHLDQMTASFRRTRLWMDLYRGLTGPGWVVEHLGHREEEEPDPEATAEIAESLDALLDREAWRDSYDLIAGLVGFGVFALEGLPAPRPRAILERIVGHLERSAEWSVAGATWHTPPDWLPPHQREVCSHGHYNLGLAHGVPGVVAFLSATAAAGVARRRCARLVQGAVDWLLAQELGPASPFRFASWTAPGGATAESRLAWCYGDLGVASSLCLASGAFSRPDWRRHAVRLARFAAGRRREAAPPTIAGLCHGDAGIAHLFNRLYQATEDEVLAEAARTWYAHTLERREPGRGVGGYRHLFTDPDTGRSQWKQPRGFLVGAAGVALALVAAASTREPAWDRLLLLSHRGAER